MTVDAAILPGLLPANSAERSAITTGESGATVVHDVNGGRYAKVVPALAVEDLAAEPERIACLAEVAALQADREFAERYGIDLDAERQRVHLLLEPLTWAGRSERWAGVFEVTQTCVRQMSSGKEQASGKVARRT